MRNGRAFERPTSAPPIVASASTFWPTTNEADSRSSGRHTTTTGIMHPGTTLTDAIRSEYWRTPDAPNQGGVRNRQSSRGQGHQLTIAEQAEHWPTPNVPNGGRTTNTTNYREDGSKQQIDLQAAATHRPTPAARDYRAPNSGESQARRAQGRETAGQQLPNFVRHEWPTPTAEPYGSSQNGINGIVGANERPSANTPSLERLSRSLLPDLTSETPGDACSPSGPISLPLWQTPATDSFRSRSGDRKDEQGLDQQARRLWKTPHGFANTDQYGKTAGGGGEFHKQAMSGSPKTAKLNPQFVEWLMLWPITWTEV